MLMKIIKKLLLLLLVIALIDTATLILIGVLASSLDHALLTNFYLHICKLRFNLSSPLRYNWWLVCLCCAAVASLFFSFRKVSPYGKV